MFYQHKIIPFLLFGLTASATGVSRSAARSYQTHNYYVVDLDSTSGITIQEVASHLNAEFVEAAGELPNHWIFRTPKSADLNMRDRETVTDLHEDFPILSRREPASLAIRHIARQVPRQRVKRAVIPAEEPTPGSLSRDIAERLGIADPLFPDQWHLVNEEYPEHMVNAAPVWDMGITGEGVISCMVDDGLDYESDDLADNFYAEGSYDYNDHVDLPKPRLSDDHHGTRCAGQIAAVKNGVCGVGIAYESKVAGVRILSGPISDVDEAAALNYGYQNTSIYSCSWGPPDDGRSMDAPSLLIQKAMLNGVQNGRDGKGSVFVFASGNGASAGDQCNFDGYTNSIYSVTVSSIDYKGERPYYSEGCAANMVSTYSSGSNWQKHIVTTDVGKNECTKSHGGTSAAAPNAVGIFALALQARPDLGWRDIQHLCVRTAQIVNPSDEDWELTASGRPFSNNFGFGKLDALAFVTAAQTWELVKPQAWIEAPHVQLDEGTMDNEGSFSGGKHIGKHGVESTIEITEEMVEENNFETIEHVTVRLWASHDRRGDVEVSLTSPNGIRSVLAERRKSDTDKTGFPGWRFMSVKHWDENPVGTWTLKVSDQNEHGRDGHFIGWTMSLWGSAKDASIAKPYTLKSTDELPIPFPPPEPTPILDSTTVSASTTKSYIKPTAFTTTSADEKEDIATGVPESGSPPIASGSAGMDDDTRDIIAFVGSVAAVLLLAGGAVLIVRRIQRNRQAGGSMYAPVAREDGEEVRMHLLENAQHPPVSAGNRRNVVFDGDEEQRLMTDGSGTRNGVASTEVGFHSGFLSDDGGDEEDAPALNRSGGNANVSS